VNLLSNAIKFTFEGFIKISIKKASLADDEFVHLENGGNENSNRKGMLTDVMKLKEMTVSSRYPASDH
jgi:hypothetical protein